jgi:hypothetical protein
MEVLGYATKHEYTDVSDLAAPMTLDVPLNRAQSRLSPHAFLAWVQFFDQIPCSCLTIYLLTQVKYREGWLNVSNFVHAPRESTKWHSAAGEVPDCGNWRPFRERVLTKLGFRLRSLQNLGDIFEDCARHTIKDCRKCMLGSESWCCDIAERIGWVHNFSSFL